MKTVSLDLGRRCAIAAGAALAVLATAPMPAHAVIHEIVAAYCSGGNTGAINASGELLPRGLLRVGEQSFARPVIASGAVAPDLTVTDKPNTKFPEGTSVFEATPSKSDHPSAAHCPKAADLP
jgi:hypothetical protein